MCNCNKHEPLYNPCNICNINPCPPKEDCDCPVKDLSTDCSVYTGEDLGCSNIKSGTPLTEVIGQLDEFICTKFEETNGALNLINVGDGEEIYKGIDGRGRREVKSLKGNDYISVTDNETTLNLDLNIEAITEGIPETFLENIGGGAGIYKEKIGETFYLRSITDESLGDGEQILSVEEDDETVKIVHSRITTKNLDISRNIDGSIDISLLETEGGLRLFYVNENYTGSTEDGSMLRPYKRLISALRDIIGSGTLTNPDIKGVRIILQSNVVTSQEELNTVLALKNKLNVNSISYGSDDASIKRTIYYQGTDEYPIDIRTAIDEIGRDANGDLNFSYEFGMSNIELVVEQSYGVFYMKESDNNLNNEKAVYVTMDNVTFRNAYFPTLNYTNLKNSDGSDILFFGNILKGQNSVTPATPHVVIDGFNKITSGITISLKNCEIVGSSQVCLKAINTIFQGDINTRYEGLYQNYSINPLDPFNYLPKSDLNTVELHNVYFIGSIRESGAYPSYDGNPYPLISNKVGGSNTFIKATRDSSASSKIPNTISIETWVYSAAFNQIFQVDYISDFTFYDSDLSSATSHISAIEPIGIFPNRRQVNANGSIVNNVKSEVLTKIRLNAARAVVNGSNYSSTISFNSDADALSAGLIPGNEYFNTTTKVLTRVAFPI